MNGKVGYDGKSKEWLEVYYSPSRWSKRMNAKQVVEHHVKVCTEYSETTRQSLNGELSLAYPWCEESQDGCILSHSNE